jgi:outer membrane protein assembly factor BamB/predicted phosphohydrolase
MKSVKSLLVLSCIVIFCTGNLKAQQKEFTFAWITDTHIGYAPAAKDLKSIIDEINESEGISFLVLSGDVTEKGKTEELKEAKSLLDKSKVKCFILPGNHDYKWSESGCAEFLNLFNDDKFAFKFNDILFLGLNSALPLRGGLGHFASHDLKWLETFFGSMKDKTTPIIFFTHYPVDKENMDNYYSVLKLFSKVNVQFMGVGHGHISKKMNFNGIDGVMARSALNKNGRSGYLLVKVRADSILIDEKQVGIDSILWSVSIPRRTSANQNFTAKNFNEWKYYDTKKTNILWADSLNYATVAPPVMSDNKVILCDMLGRINCYDINTGNKLWEYQLDNSIVSTPALNNGKVLIISVDGRVYNFDMETGKIKWQTKFNFPIIGSPVIKGDTAFVGTSEYSFIAIGLNTGNQLWSFRDLKGHVESTPVIEGDKIYFTAWDGFLYSLDKSTGKLNWKWSEEKPNFYYSPAAAKPVIMKGKIIITAPNKYVTVINSETGKTVWRSNKHYSWESIGFSENNKHIYVKGFTDTLFCYTVQSDSLKLEWMNVLGFGFDISPVIVKENKGSVYLPAGNGIIYCVDDKTGKFKWDYFLGESTMNSPLFLNDGSIILSNMDGVIKRILK